MLKKILWSIGFIMLMVTQVNAQSIGFGPQVSYQKARDADQGNLMGGAALRFKLSPALGVEGAINSRLLRTRPSGKWGGILAAGWNCPSAQSQNSPPTFATSSWITLLKKYQAAMA